MWRRRGLSLGLEPFLSLIWDETVSLKMRVFEEGFVTDRVFEIGIYYLSFFSFFFFLFESRVSWALVLVLGHFAWVTY